MIPIEFMNTETFELIGTCELPCVPCIGEDVVIEPLDLRVVGVRHIPLSKRVVCYATVTQARKEYCDAAGTTSNNGHVAAG